MFAIRESEVEFSLFFKIVFLFYFYSVGSEIALSVDFVLMEINVTI